ncbi:glycoside hydrolase family 13 protein [Chakrabartyella piscis]|uniref:glycoside hydrolase family 13 protein n=1 Tax=Chakrabartyella piscis TaxID=2918914 RepID=UPI002958BB9C|nr:glycoside hydrolase family 13 protein [Chakrabartyella piscis]
MQEKKFALGSEPMFYKEALFSDESEFYRIPVEPTKEDSIFIRLRTGYKTISSAFLCTEKSERPMKVETHSGCFTYYMVELPPTDRNISYYFRVQTEDATLYYTKYGAFDFYSPEGWFTIVKDFQTPDWAKSAIMYQIFPDRFCNGDVTNDVYTGEYEYLKEEVMQKEAWLDDPVDGDYRHFYGGDLQGILQKLDYLEDLGIEVLYLNPIFVSPSNHKYDIGDYDYVDPHLGVIFPREDGKPQTYAEIVTNKENLEASNQLFADLVKEAHSRGMRVVVDGVFNHCGAFHKWLDGEGIYGDGALENEESPYHDYFYWNEDGTYDGWWGHKNHPKLNMEHCKELEEEILRIGEKWVSEPFNADGWRLDVAADLGNTREYNHEFWKKFNKRVKQANPEAVILAEHYGDAMDWLGGDEWDSIMNYDAFMEPVTWFLTGVSKHSEERRDNMYNNTAVFWGSMSYQTGKLPVQSIYLAMNELSNHDHSRFLTRTNGKVGRLHTAGSAAAIEGIRKEVMREAVLLQMTWVGSPTIYYGDEAGVAGWTDPDNRKTYPWGAEDQSLIDFHKECIRIRKENKALRHGSLKGLSGEEGILAYGRFIEENKCLILINNCEEKKEVSIPVWQMEVEEQSCMISLLTSKINGFHVETAEFVVEAGHLQIELPEKSAMILKEV